MEENIHAPIALENQILKRISSEALDSWKN